MSAEDMDVDGEEAKVPLDRTEVSEGLMKTYYARLFPANEFYKWLAYGNDGKHVQADKGYFQRREFCFTLPGSIFVRYQSFKDGSDLREALHRRCPEKIDIGPVYNIDPQKRLSMTGTFTTQERELVFDIDLTDYDDVRSCGSEGHICNKCWPFMACAIKVLDDALRQDFGFKHLLWVFSGRRGVHCWVCDERARKLKDSERAAIAAFLTVYKGQEKGGVKLDTDNIIHPSVQRAYETCHSAWINHILPKQQTLEDPRLAETVWSRLPDPSVASRVQRAAARQADASVAMWEELEATAESLERSRNRDSRQLKRILQNVVLSHSYPRLDVEVSKKMNHLLKAPFCVHPKTGKLCMPIDPKHAWEFDPEAVPTLAEVVQEMDSACAGDENCAKTNTFHSQSLEHGLEIFHHCFLDRLRASAREELSKRARAAAAQPTVVW